MDFEFKANLIKSVNKFFVRIPFNVWEVSGQKGLIPVKAEVSGFSFECKLIPKGNGIYNIPVKKEVVDKIDPTNELNVKFKIISGLSRINSNSPYSKENPVRKIDVISSLQQPRNGLCAQTSVAMLAGVSVEEAAKVMKSGSGQASLSKVLETLAYYGLAYKKPVYTRGREAELPKCCIVNVRNGSRSHLLVHFDGKYYDTDGEILNDYKFENVISYIEVAVG